MKEMKDLRKKQVEAINFIKTGTSTLLLADVGTGKTVIALTALRHLCDEGMIDRALVVAPKRVATDVWVQEIFEWNHLSQRMSIACVAGLPAPQRKSIIEDDSIKVVVISYDLLPWLMTEYPTPPFDAVVFDEIDKMKDRTAYRFCGKKEENKWIFKGMREYHKHFDTRIGLTGTPAGNHLLDLWAECFVLQRDLLSGSFNQFQRRHFYPTDYRQRQWEILPGHEQKIYDAIAPITFRIERDDQIPPVVELPPRWVDMPESFAKKYRKFERDYIVEVENGETIEAGGAMTGYGKLRAMAAGFSYSGRDLLPAITHFLYKYDELDDLISELQGQQLMIVYHFCEQLRRLQIRYPDLENLGGDTSVRKAALTIDAWNSGSLLKLAVQPQSAGHGLNLQKSGAKHICMLTIPDSAGLYEQVIGRLRRTGSKADSIFIHKILTRDTVDEDRLAVVQGKLKTQQDLLNAMKARCEK